jgi:epoxyqueuosine reductase
MSGPVDAAEVRELARRCGFELAGVTPATPAADRARYHGWVEAGCAGEMRYLTDRRAALRDDPRHLLAPAQSVVCVGQAYGTAQPAGEGISRYAWGDDYHGAMRRGLRRLDALLGERAGAGYESKICVDTAPLLERSYAQLAGLGWIGRNACLIHEGTGSRYFLGELLVSIPIAAGASCAPPPNRCGTCRRCIDACPTAAIAPEGGVDARRCISYLTIELRGAIPEGQRASLGGHVFGCDICQDVCPWNRRAPDASVAPPLADLAALSEAEFARRFGGTAVERARYSGFLRNVAVAMGNSQRAEFRAPLEKLAESADAVVAEHARWALGRLGAAK